MLLLFAIIVGTTSVYSLTCHCLNGSQCHTNGYCANGCERGGWHGPGCQVGNLAFGKAAQQSTTYSENNYEFNANLSLDLSVPNDNGSHFCSHTAPDNPAGANKVSSWWAVTLDTTNYYVIIDVILLNRKSPYSYRLANFIILYSNETEGDPDPNSSTWHEFARENGTVGSNRTYTCKKTAIAKRVAVYLTAFPQNPGAILTLCEVLVIGYEHQDCPSGFTGPGCLLRACDQCGATDGNCTGDFGSCRYDICPDQSQLPPDCWITVSNLSGLDIQSNATCNSVLFSAVLPDTQRNIGASWLHLQVTSADGQVLESANLSLLGTNSVYYNLTGAAADTSYNVSLKLVYCDGTNSSCFNSTGTKDFTVLTGKREYVFSQNISCIFVNATSTTFDCEPLSAIEIMCESEGFGGSTVNSSSLPICGLQRDRGYNCSITATVNADTVERHSAYIVTGPYSTSATSEENITGAISAVSPGDSGAGVLPGIVGGSISVIVIVVAIIAVVYCRRQQDTPLHASALVLDTKSNGQSSASSLDMSRLQSVYEKQNESPYESLHRDLHLQTTEDYASLE